jgi:hypothetical protein
MLDNTNDDGQLPEEPSPSHKITKAEVVPLENGCFGVSFEFDDGDTQVAEATSKANAEFYADNRVGDELPVGAHPFLLSGDKLPYYYEKDVRKRAAQEKSSRDALTAGRIRSGRDDDRPTEDDIAKRKLGEQGLPGRAPKEPVADEDELQIPKPLDPGHTA